MTQLVAHILKRVVSVCQLEIKYKLFIGFTSHRFVNNILVLMLWLHYNYSDLINVFTVRLAQI